MIRAIHIQNLKCFDSLSIELAPLTILSGFNSAGKSTTLQALLLLSQTLSGNHLGPSLDLNGALVTLGTPADVLGTAGAASPLTLGLGFGEGREVNWSFNLSGDRRFLKANELLIQNGASVLRLDGATLTGLFPREQDELATIASVELHRLVYLSAARGLQSDIFPIPEDGDLEAGNVGPLGQFAAWWLHNCGDAEIATSRRCPGSQNVTLRSQVNAWAAHLFSQAELNSVPIPKTNLIRLELKTGLTSDWSRPANNGFGVSYAFPILVAGLASPTGRTVVIDSPEAHLHPRGQSRMGCYLAQMASSGIQLVVETHSDHLLNGVRVALKNGIVSPHDVAIYFFSGREGAPVVRLSVSGAGDISDWPEGFFDQSEQDLASLAGWS